MTPIAPDVSRGGASPQHRTYSLRWTLLTVIIALLCIVCSAIVGYFAVMILKDPYTKFMDSNWLWGVAGCVTCIPPVLAGLGCLVYLAGTSARVLRAIQKLLFVAIVAMVAQTILGFLVVRETDAKGGDWEGLAIFAVYVLCVMPTIFIGALCAFLFLPLAKLRRRVAG